MDVQKFYSAKAGLYHRFVFASGYPAGLRALFRSLGLPGAGTKVLDAGCGTGVLTRGLYGIAADQGLDNVRFQGFDLTPAMLERFEEWASDHRAYPIETRQGNALDLATLPEDWKDYDAIVTSGMLEYIAREKLSSVLAGLGELLAPGGKMVVCISRKNWLMHWLMGRWWKAEMYTRDEMEKIMAEAGFREVSFERFPAPYSYLGVWGHVVVAQR